MNLHQEEAFQPIGETPQARWTRRWWYAEIMFGWLATTLALVRFTNVMKGE